jgi:quercetin dioxygenase-like cupin family protein
MPAGADPGMLGAPHRRVALGEPRGLANALVVICREGAQPDVTWGSVRSPHAEQKAMGMTIMKGPAMRPRMLRAMFLALVTVLLLAGALAPRLAAQEATPGAITAIELAPGVTAEVFAGAPSARAAEQTIYLARFVFQPGAAIFPHGHPGTTVLGVQSGSLGWTLLEGTAHVVRGAASGGTATEELAEPGTEVILEPGDAIFYEDDVVHTARGAGDEEAVILGTLVLTSGEPLLMPAEAMAGMDMAATPAP